MPARLAHQIQRPAPHAPLRAIKSFVPGITRDNSGIPGMPTRVGATTSGRPLWVGQPEPSSAAVGGCPLNPDHETRLARRSPGHRPPPHPAAPSFLCPALRARGNRLKSPKNPRLPLHDPGVRAPARLGGGGGSSERTRLAATSPERRLANTSRMWDGSRIVPLYPASKNS